MGIRRQGQHDLGTVPQRRLQIVETGRLSVLKNMIHCCGDTPVLRGGLAPLRQIERQWRTELCPNSQMMLQCLRDPVAARLHVQRLQPAP